MNISLTVFFEDPFWVGVFERSCDDKYEAAKVTFGTEPKDYEVYAYVLKNFNRIKFSTPIKETASVQNKINPKRLQRKIQQKISEQGIGTKAQNALKLDFENKKIERKAISKLRRQEEEQFKFNLRQEKKKQKRKGH